MKVKVKNLGVLKQAEFSLGNLTIICGGNNTGKTYATYALFGFLKLWKEVFYIDISDEQVKTLLDKGTITINLLEYLENINTIIGETCENYTQLLPRVFGSSEDYFKQTEFTIELDVKDNKLAQGYRQSISTGTTKLFFISKNNDDTNLIINLLSEDKNIGLPRELIKRIISDAIKDIVFYPFFPSPFIASAERTGTAIFRKELNFARNRLLEEISQTDKDINPLELLSQGYDDYALPIKSNVEFTRKIESIAKQKSFIFNEYPELIEDFTDIIGGSYLVTPTDELYYVPKGKKTRLSMDESSSAVRSLLDIGFYIKHQAQKGDLLIIDEPELNLHPENQRRVARLLARLVNLGIKIFITTHSDYIIKELNTLIMLNQDQPYLQEIAEKEGYIKEELLTTNQVKVYVAESTLTLLEGNKRRTNCNTITEANITPDLGIEVPSFDTAIDTMNRIQEEIIWGEE
ncbi:AAA family ATPase [Crocosphaera sp.]|uniref:AAA family ATPase n=1 Tax=Crocosphaera sp. TaxID=2729996 RepID=UPI002635DCBC|nr:AAA family ATPase [Crocosphaera sp.]MDJ0581046.1 AAA family ATPase [Crocosphaera sp.]